MLSLTLVHQKVVTQIHHLTNTFRVEMQYLQWHSKFQKYKESNIKALIKYLNQG